MYPKDITVDVVGVNNICTECILDWIAKFPN